MTAPLLLSRRAAAKLLGVGRNGTLAALIARGVLTPVTVNGREWISRAQVEEFARVGEKPAPAPRRRQRAEPSWKEAI